MDIETGIVIAFSIRQPAAGFSRLDRDELESWASSGRRVEYEDAWDAANQFALIYRGGEPWSSWAVTRESTEILVWDCVTHHDLGRFATIQGPGRSKVLFSTPPPCSVPCVL